MHNYNTWKAIQVVKMENEFLYIPYPVKFIQVIVMETQFQYVLYPVKESVYGVSLCEQDIGLLIGKSAGTNQ